jgi:hypothetical protein
MLNISEKYVLDKIMKEGGMPEIPKACVRIAKYMLAEHEYQSKNIRLQEWGSTSPNLLEIVIAVFTAVLLEEPITYQAIVGRLNHLINVSDAKDRFNIIADVIGLISLTGLIDINKPGQGQYINITTEYEILDILEKEKHIIIIHRPQPIESNWDEEQHSMLLGHPMNHHEEEICLNHLNKLNAIPLQLNSAFVTMYKEKPKHAPKTPKAEDQWQQFMGDSFDKYMELLKLGKPFYLGHKYCTRGRTYACGYHVTTQGNGFKKAIIELYNEELVEG